MDSGERMGGLLRGWRRLFFTSVFSSEKGSSASWSMTMLLVLAVANCWKASSKPVMALWMLNIFLDLFGFFFAVSSVRLWSLASRSGRERNRKLRTSEPGENTS
ncbi:hypothetical protein EYF80_059557 [Liparis tanakae]|uniref:Uncharacterized protein n=1 Tax=Liparis tanakae TaxID=230148 RepID=A0A4Z2ENG8_9TELE|nr:hypothetical protein EYF80_059557 [Liparis tanakae]